MDSIAICEQQQTTDLADLAVEINEEHRLAEEAAATAIQHARAAGELLIQAKGQCDHGGWLPWLRGNFRGSVKMAQRYMVIAKRWPELETKTTRVSHLPIRQAVKMLTKPLEPRSTANVPLYKLPFAKLPADRRKSLCEKWWDIFASHTVLFAMAGRIEKEIADITQMPERDVSLILDPEPPIRGVGGLERTMGNPELFVAYRRGVESTIAGLLSSAYRSAAYNAQREGLPELTPMLEAQSMLLWRRADKLRHSEFEVMQAFGSISENASASIWCCMLFDARIGLGIDPEPNPGPDSCLLTQFMKWEKMASDEGAA